MTDEAPGKRGDAAWKEQREAIAQRNAAARKRAQAGQKSRDGVIHERVREDTRRENEHLRALNAHLEKRSARGFGPR